LLEAEAEDAGGVGGGTISVRRSHKQVEKRGIRERHDGCG
jgi:hypothetical protein